MCDQCPDNPLPSRCVGITVRNQPSVACLVEAIRFLLALVEGPRCPAQPSVPIPGREEPPHAAAD